MPLFLLHLSFPLCVWVCLHKWPLKNDIAPSQPKENESNCDKLNDQITIFKCESFFCCFIISFFFFINFWINYVQNSIPIAIKWDIIRLHTRIQSLDFNLNPMDFKFHSIFTHKLSPIEKYIYNIKHCPYTHMYKILKLELYRIESAYVSLWCALINLLPLQIPILPFV